ncbi:MAG TPA: glycine oxidase ThiO [Candidatus Limnocylindrales bacterium]|nr:glycine oxidase ThiO [Candidatus Limnocylindrales bacterium]
MSPDVIVVGGGVIGSAVAFQLSRSGLRVTVFDAGLPGQASAAAAGVISAPVDAPTGPLAELAQESARLHGPLAEELRDRTGIDPGYRDSDVLYLAASDADELVLRRRRDLLDQAGVHVGWLDAARVHDVEPAIAADTRAGLHLPKQHQISPPALVQALRRAAADLGAELRPRAVDALLHTGERVSGVMAGGEPVTAAEVVIANGAWAGGFASVLDLSIPVRPVRGQMVGVRSPRSVLRNVLFAPDVYLLRKADGWIYVGATAEEAGYDARLTARAVRDLLAQAVALVPALGDASFSHGAAGLRPATPDGLPLIGRLGPLRGLTIAGGHFREGVLLAPITAEVIADLIEGRAPRVRLDAFDPTRFRVRAA